MQGKKIGIAKYSDPKRVELNSQRLFGADVRIELSDRARNKYMLLNPDTKKFVHFGQMGYEDYTRHRDELRRERFRKRNAKWGKHADKYTPGFLSYYLLW